VHKRTYYRALYVKYKTNAFGNPITNLYAKPVLAKFVTGQASITNLYAKPVLAKFVTG
jgi:hypothetical protein